MKIMKRISAILLTICLLVPCFSMIALAADGVIFFEDPETSVGENFTITGTVAGKGEVIGDVTVQMSYNTEYLRFVEGDGINADSAGNLTYTGSGNGSSDRLEFSMTFQALKEGDTRLEQGSATVTSSSGETIDCEEGYSDITIGEGDPSKILPVGKTMTVTINNEEYTLSEAFTETELPSGFTAGEITYNGESYKGAVQENSGLQAAYLIDSQQKGEFWLYNSEESLFYPFEEIMISDTYYIVILDGTDEVTMPSKYTEASIEINGTEFPGWVEPDREGFYILYAVNNEGQKSLYLFDSQEHTYQRMETPKTAKAPKKAEGLWDKITGTIIDYLIWIMVGVGCLLAVLLVLLIVVAIKLRHRNLELDDLYDEYGIDLDESESAAGPKAKSKKKSSYDEDSNYDEYYDDDDYDDDDYDDYNDDDYNDDDYDDDYYDEEEEDELADLRKEFGTSSPKKGNYDEYYDDEDFEDFEFEEEDFDLAKPKKNSKKDDTFEMDFIDLD